MGKMSAFDPMRTLALWPACAPSRHSNVTSRSPESRLSAYGYHWTRADPQYEKWRDRTDTIGRQCRCFNDQQSYIVDV